MTDIRTGTSDIYDLLSRLSATRGLEEMLDEVLSASMSLFQVDMGYIALYDPETHIAARRGLPDLFLEYFSRYAPVPAENLPPGRALATRHRVIVPDVYSDEDLRPHLPIIEQAGFVSMQATPLITRSGQAVGSICTYCRNYGSPPDDALETLDLYARLAADLIEREQTNTALLLSEKRLRRATEAANVYPWEFDFKTKTVWYMGRGESSNPETTPELRDVVRLIHPEDRRRVIRAVLRAKKGSGEFSVEHRGLAENGVVPWYLVSGEVIRDSDGRPERLVGVSHDITNRKNAETELQESGDRFRRLYDLTLSISNTEGLQGALDEVLDAVIPFLAADGGVIWLSGEDADAPVSFAASKGVSQDYLNYVLSLSREEFKRGLIHEAVKTRQLAIVPDVLTHPVLGRHGEALNSAGIASMLAWPLLGRGDKVRGVLSAHFARRYVPTTQQLWTLELYGRLAVATVEREELLAEQKQTGNALREALALRNEFLGLVSHELRTPMTIIRGLASVLERQELAREDLVGVYGDLRDESERLYWLIENMLRLTRVEAGQRLEADDILLHRTLKSMVGRLQRNYPTLDLRVELPASDIIVSAIETYLEQILHNLLQNAAKYNKQDAPVDILTVVSEDFVEFCVADRGIGVKDRQAVFQPFQREEDADKRASGMGLGLAVCKALVEAQGGRIWVDARDEGGSMFCFTLPRVSPVGMGDA